jgi:predicted amidohydrolase YtcJ
MNGAASGGEGQRATARRAGLAHRAATALGCAVAALVCQLAQASPEQDYMLHCMGCHGTQAQGVAGKVPPLANSLGRFMRTAEGRNYVLRVPGAANSALSDHQLAAVLNWLAGRFDASGADLAPFTSEEVSRLRHEPLLSVGAARSAVVRNLAATGPAPPAQYSTVAATQATPATRPTVTSLAPPADVVLTDGKIYTVDASHSIATALAVKSGRIVFVGSTADAKRWVAPTTRVEPLDGRLVLPGLIDAHMHPLDIADLDVCDLKSRPMPLNELSTFVGKCLAHYQTPPGERLVVHQWTYTAGNQPDPAHPTLRAALDAVSTKVQIQLLGNDGHHGAFNSLALAHARNSKGAVIGLSKATLAGEFAEYRPFVGVDAAGEPNGAVNEDARYLINPHSMMYTDLAEVSKVPEKVPQRLNSAGITAILDAMASPDGLPVYDKLQSSGNLTVRVTLAQFYDPSHTRKPDGQVDYDSMVSQAKTIRAKYADNPLIRADVIKLFADGVLEGNPFAVPPTLPSAAALKPFLQPIFAVDAGGHATVQGYVDTASALCADVRAHPTKYSASADIDAFTKAHGYHPAQCTISAGQLQHAREVILEYVKRMHLAGFNMHIHAISDRSVRTAVDAIEAARQADGVATTRDALAHLQLVAPSDVLRIGRDHLYVAFTYAWMNTDTDYDITVIPFFQKVAGNGYAALHPAGSYYESNTYPVKAIKLAGGILAAGSDAPVETPDPRPFINMTRAVTRSLPGKPPLSPQQSISIRDAIDAYTINGARMLNLQDAGSLEVGKSADFIVLDRDILGLADGGNAEGIATTRVLATWFRGKQVYAAGARGVH